MFELRGRPAASVKFPPTSQADLLGVLDAAVMPNLVTLLCLGAAIGACFILPQHPAPGPEAPWVYIVECAWGGLEIELNVPLCPKTERPQ